MAPPQPQVDWGTAQPIQPQVDWGSASPIGGPSSTSSPQGDWRDPLTRVEMHQPVHSASDLGREVVRGVGNIGAGGLGVLLRPVATAEGLGHALMHPLDTASQFADQATAHPLETGESMMGQAAALGGVGKVAGESAGTIAKIPGAVRSAAMEDPNVAALRGMRVGPKSPDAVDVMRDVNAVKPYLQGTKSLEQFQGKIPAVKNEVWAPYKQAVDAEAGRTIVGPDGPTTVGELEAERVKTSALLRKLKSGGPEAIQLATQKGMNEADLLAREKAIQGALDPHLRSVGIDPTGIRNQFGSVARLGERMSGQSTLLENKPMGFGKMANISIKQPLKAPAEILSGMRDLAAGRPKWSGSPTDVGISEAFRQGGAKPNFGQYAPRSIAGLLNAPQQTIPLSAAKFPTGTPGALFPAQEGGATPSNPDFPGIAREIYDQGVIKPNHGYTSGGAHPEMSGRYVPSPGTVTLRGEGNAPVRYQPKGEVISPPKGPVRKFGKPKTGAP